MLIGFVHCLFIYSSGNGCSAHANGVCRMGGFSKGTQGKSIRVHVSHLNVRLCKD